MCFDRRPKEPEYVDTFFLNDIWLLGRNLIFSFSLVLVMLLLFSLRLADTIQTELVLVTLAVRSLPGVTRDKDLHLVVLGGDELQSDGKTDMTIFLGPNVTVARRAESDWEGQGRVSRSRIRVRVGRHGT